MRPRAVLTLMVTLGLAMTVIASPAAADTSAFSASAATGGRSTNGGPYVTDSNTQTGQEVLGPLTFDHRWALEFDISSLPAGATITSATLSLRTSFGNGGCSSGACLIDLGGYAGNGTGELADLAAGSSLLTFGPLSAGYENHDVTAFVLGLYTGSSDWAGFRLSRAAGSIATDFLIWDGPQNGIPPILTVVYTPAAPPTPVPTPIASMADAAMGKLAPASLVPALGFAMLLVGALGTLAVVRLRRR